MKFLKRTLAAAGAALTICGPANAGSADPGVTATIEVVNTPVTYRRPGAKASDPSLVTFAAYKVTIYNKTTNDLNRLYIRNVVASNSPGTDPVIWDSVAPPLTASQYTCTGFGTSTLSCDTTLSAPTVPGGSQTSFIIVARAPKDGPSITVNGFAGGYEGNGVGNGCCAVPFDAPAVTDLTDSTDTTQNSKVRSYIKNNGTNGGSSQLFTGDRYIPTSIDPSTTNVDIPFFTDLADFAVGTITETAPPLPTGTTCGNFGRLLICPVTQLDIFKNSSDPSAERLDLSGTGRFLYITLRLDSLAVVRGTNISDIRIQYTSDGITPTTSDVGLCSSTSPEVYPCIIQRDVYTGSAGKDLKGDYYWIIKHFKNGGYKAF